MNRIHTVGHSTQDLEKFLKLLTDAGVTAIADVRSVPASRFTPQFNRAPLTRALRQVNVKYVFLGKELGARSEDPSCYENGRVIYARLARTELFQAGIGRLQRGSGTESIAIMCAEQEPLDCHRTLLVSRVLHEQGMKIDHIHPDGQIESHDEAMNRLLRKHGLDRLDLIRTPQEMLDEALTRQEQKVAFVPKDDNPMMAHRG